MIENLVADDWSASACAYAPNHLTLRKIAVNMAATICKGNDGSTVQDLFSFWRQIRQNQPRPMTVKVPDKKATLVSL